jgi:hypothetical protein
MVEEKIVLSALWIAALFVWHQGDLLRLYSGDYNPGDEISNNRISMKNIWLAAAVIMTIPVILVVLSLILAHPANRWMNIGAGIFYTGFNLIGLPGYPSIYDKFLIFVGIVLTVMLSLYAWNWV